MAERKIGAGDDEELMSGINVAPLVDVCLVLVIIFMVTAPLLSNPAFKVELPKARTQEGEEKDKITLSLGADNRFGLDSTEFKSLDELTPKLKERLAESESKLVVLRADRNAFSGQLTELMARAKEAGAESLTIATEQPKAAGGGKK
ncbi:MAG: biopolymer transporter ExbD [Elusimicrobia bacterium]|nr:biopolymer transporter ExbD [Elusimicrobiota bacterium]